MPIYLIFSKEPELFYNIPDKFKDKELCETAVRYDGSYLKWFRKPLKHRSCAWKPYVAVRMP